MSPLKRLGAYFAHPRCHGNKIPSKFSEANILITNKEVFGLKELEKFPKLKLVCVAATGVNNIDLAAAQGRGIGVANVAGYSTTTVVEHTMMFMMLTKGL